MEEEIKTNLSQEDMKKLQGILSQDIIDSHIWRYVQYPKRNLNNHYVICEDGSYVVRFEYFNYHPVDSKVWSSIDNTFYVDRDGYYHWSDKSVHRTVAFTFLNNIDGKPCVNHKDGNKQNNYYKNLEWCTSKENTQHYRTADCFEESRKVHDKKMSEQAKGKTHVVPESVKKKLSIENRRENLPPERRKKISDGLRGRRLSEESRKKIGESTHIKQKNRKCINNGEIEKRVYKSELNKYLGNGWKLGRLSYCWVYNETNEKFIHKRDLQKFLNMGYCIGRYKHTISKKETRIEDKTD